MSDDIRTAKEIERDIRTAKELERLSDLLLDAGAEIKRLQIELAKERDHSDMMRRLLDKLEALPR